MPVPDIAREPLDVLDAIYSTRAMRYLKPDPIPDELIRAVLDAAIRGPSGGNAQGWGWVVVRDTQTKRRIAGWYREGWERAYGTGRDPDELSAAIANLGRSNYDSADHLARNLAEAPVWIIPVQRGIRGRETATSGSSIYGCVQNLMLAARAHGLGATLTTLHMGHEEEVAKLLGLPDDARTMALIPLGYPARGRFTEPKRRPLDEVMYWNRWGEGRAS